MIRFIKEDEIDAEKAKFKAKYPWAAEPNWPYVLVVIDEETGAIIGRSEIQVRTLVGMLDADGPLETIRTIDAVDGWLAGRNVMQYEFIVPNKNHPFQKVIEKHYKYAKVKLMPAKMYFVRR